MTGIYQRFRSQLGRLSARSQLDARSAAPLLLIAFLAPALLFYAGLAVYPVLRTAYNSFHAIKPQGVVEYVGIANFTTILFADATFWKAVGNIIRGCS